MKNQYSALVMKANSKLGLKNRIVTNCGTMRRRRYDCVNNPSKRTISLK